MSLSGILQHGSPAQPADDDATIFRIADGHGARLIVERDGDDVTITVQTSHDQRDTKRAVLSRRVAVALRDALEGI